MQTVLETLNTPLFPKEAPINHFLCITPLVLILFCTIPYVIHFIGTWTVIHIMKVDKASYFEPFKMWPFFNWFTVIHYYNIWMDFSKFCRDDKLKNKIDQEIKFRLGNSYRSDNFYWVKSDGFSQISTRKKNLYQGE